MNRIFAAFLLLFASCSPPAVAQDRADPFTAETCQGTAAGTLELAVLNRTVWTKAASTTGASGYKSHVRVDLAKALDANWTCYSYDAELVLPTSGCHVLIDNEGGATALKQTGVARTDEVRWDIQERPGYNTETSVCRTSGSSAVERATIVITINSSRNDAKVSRPDGRGKHYHFPVELEHG